MKIKEIAILSILSIVLFAGCGDTKKIDDSVVVETKKEVKQPLPIFNLKITDGKTIKILVKKDGWVFKGLENKVILLTFFGTWCPPCKAEIPHLKDIRSKLKDNFEVLAINVGPRGGGENTPEELAAFIKKFQVTYPIASGADNSKLFEAVSQLDPNGSIPFMVLFNKNGQYVQYYIGMTPEEMLFKDISSTIKMK